MLDGGLTYWMIDIVVSLQLGSLPNTDIRR